VSDLVQAYQNLTGLYIQVGKIGCCFIFNASRNKYRNNIL